MLDDLPDMSISRSVDAVSWGIPIPFRPGSVVYVWFEALINYATGAGFPSDDAAFVRWFPSALHVIGKDVVRFHCVLWPAMLMAAGLPLPRRVYAHGWVLDTGAKMSKSTGTGADPVVLAETFGPDPLRFYLLHDVVWGKDGEFSSARLAENYNAFLANGLGNLLSRAVSMAQKYFGAVPPASGDDPLRARTEAHTREAITAWDELRLTDAVQAAYRIVRDGNEQIQAREPWKMAKDAARRDELAAFLYAVLESLRIAGVLLSPALPRKAPDLLAALGTALGADFDTNVRWGGLRPGTALRGGAPLFPRYETPAP
jgi:methionyl-tRNA synthetase